MARSENRTALILGPQDADDLRAAVASRLVEIEEGAEAPEGEYERLGRMQRRLDAAARRLERRGRNGRSEAAA